LGNGRSEALSYTSAHFVLISNAREDIVRRVAVRLEQIYQAYARYLPPRQSAAEPTTVVLVRSVVEYRKITQGEGRNLLNPAFFDARNNRVLCACDLQELGDELERARNHHEQILDELRSTELKLKERFKGAVPTALRNNLA